MIRSLVYFSALFLFLVCSLISAPVKAMPPCQILLDEGTADGSMDWLTHAMIGGSFRPPMAPEILAAIREAQAQIPTFSGFDHFDPMTIYYLLQRFFPSVIPLLTATPLNSLERSSYFLQLARQADPQGNGLFSVVMRHLAKNCNNNRDQIPEDWAQELSANLALLTPPAAKPAYVASMETAVQNRFELQRARNLLQEGLTVAVRVGQVDDDPPSWPEPAEMWLYVSGHHYRVDRIRKGSVEVLVPRSDVRIPFFADPMNDEEAFSYRHRWFQSPPRHGYPAVLGPDGYIYLELPGEQKLFYYTDTRPTIRVKLPWGPGGVVNTVPLATFIGSNYLPGTRPITDSVALEIFHGEMDPFDLLPYQNGAPRPWTAKDLKGYKPATGQPLP
jgi:hypothetical protein